MIAGIKVAMNDVFATPDRVKLLEEIVGNNYVSEREAMMQVAYVTSFHKLHHIAMGSFLAASGAIVMHYTGMMAQRGPFHREWNIHYIVSSIVAAIVICFVGFWIIFRLRWKIKQSWLRYVSAGVISLAVCFLHFFGMVSVKYFYEEDLYNEGVCESMLEKHGVSPSAWTVHQMIMLGIGILVPTISLLVANTINQEMILAYEFASRTNAIVSSLFPTQIRDRMLADDKKKLKSFLSKDATDDSSSADPENGVAASKSKPIADLFSATTIMFGKSLVSISLLTCTYSEMSNLNSACFFSGISLILLHS